MLIGILSVAGAATLLGIMPTLQKQVLLDGLHMNSLMFYSNLIILLVSAAMALAKGKSLRAKPAQLIQALAMGVVGMLITSFLLNTSLVYLPVGMTIMLNFLYPTVVCVVMGTVFRQGFSKLQVVAIVCSIVGMVFLAGEGGNVELIGILTALASAFTYGAYLIANEKGPANELSIEAKLFYVALPGTLFWGVVAPATGTMQLPAGAGGWLFVLGAGLFNVGGYFLMMYGISRMGASTAAFVSMLEPIVSVVFGTIWFHDPVTQGVVIGGIMVLASIFLIAVDGNRKAKAPQPPEKKKATV